MSIRDFIEVITKGEKKMSNLGPFESNPVVPATSNPSVPATPAPVATGGGVPYPDSAFFQDITVSGPGFVFDINPKQFATEVTANDLASKLVGAMVASQNLSGVYSWNHPMYLLLYKGSTINAGLLADSVNRYGVGGSNPLWPK